jgi:chemotaxis response regulator CheB
MRSSKPGRYGSAVRKAPFAACSAIVSRSTGCILGTIARATVAPPRSGLYSALGPLRPSFAGYIGIDSADGERLMKRTRARRAVSPATTDGAADTRDDSRERGSLPIVGIGASAGGLEAFSALLKHLPVDTGMGFVLVQHLDPGA